jgi:hypothetical protein
MERWQIQWRANQGLRRGRGDQRRVWTMSVTCIDVVGISRTESRTEDLRTSGLKDMRENKQRR